MTDQSATEHLYRLIFNGLADNSPETLQRLKGVFIADLDLSIPEVQNILNQAGSQVCCSSNKHEILQKHKKLKMAGALVHLIGLEGELEPEEKTATKTTNAVPEEEWDEELEAEQSEEAELELEFDLDELEKPAKKKKRDVVHLVSEELSLDDTLKELGIASEPVPSVNEVFAQESKTQNSPLFDIETDSHTVTKLTTLEAKTEKVVDNLPLFEFSSDSVAEQATSSVPVKSEEPRLFDDLTLQDAPDTLQLLEEIVPQEPEQKFDQSELEDKSAEEQFTLSDPEPLSVVQNTKTSEVLSEQNLSLEISLEDEPQASNLNPTSMANSTIAVPATLTTEMAFENPVVQEEAIVETKTKIKTVADRIFDDYQPEPESQAGQVAEPVVLVVSTKKYKASKRSNIPWDLIVPILFGAIILGLGNYFYFEGLKEDTALEQLKIDKELKKVVTDIDSELLATTKTTSANSDVVYQVEKLKSSVLTMTGEIVKTKKMFKIRNLEINTPKPPALTADEIIAGQAEKPWLSKVIVTNVSFEPDSTGQFVTISNAKAYIVDQKVSQRFPTNIKIQGNFDSVNNQLTMNLTVGTLTKGVEYYINKLSAEQFEFGFKLDLRASITK